MIQIMNSFIGLPLCMLHDFLVGNIVVCYVRPTLVAVMESFKWRFCREPLFSILGATNGFIMEAFCNVCMIAVLFVSGYVIDIS